MQALQVFSCFRTFGKVRSSGDTLIPSPRRPTDARSSSLMTNQRRSSESRDGRPSSTRVYSKDNRMNSSVFPISVRTDTKETRAEKTLSSPVQRRISSSEYVPTAEGSGKFVSVFAQQSGRIMYQSYVVWALLFIQVLTAILQSDFMQDKIYVITFLAWITFFHTRSSKSFSKLSLSSLSKFKCCTVLLHLKCSIVLV